MPESGDGLEALILEGKTTAPAFDARFVRRSARIDALRGGASRIVTVTAPAGYGKTSFLAEWRQLDDRESAWITLSADDDDPATLLHLVAHACATFAPGAAAFTGPLSTADGGMLGRIAPALALALSRSIRPFVLFVDDLHELRGHASTDALAVVLGGVPEGSQVVLASRHRVAPSAGGALVGAEGQIGAEDLRIDVAGAAGIAEAAGAEVDDATLSDWVDQCAGWATGLHMYALLHRNGRATSVGDRAEIADYLYRECLRDLPDASRRLLLDTSILPVHLPDLCDHLLGRTDSAQVLRDLEERQLFVTADRRHHVYRLHPLFREYLQEELRLDSPDTASAMHLRASRWFQEHGQLPAAVDHAIAAGDLDAAAALVAAAAIHAYESGQVATLARWVEEIGDTALLTNPSAVVVATWLSLLAGTDAAAGKWGTLLDRLPDADERAHGINLVSAKAMVRAIMLRRGMTAALADAETAVAAEGLESPWRDPALQVLGSTLLHAGDEGRAVEVLEEAAHTADAHRNPATIVMCSVELALIDIEAGRWQAARGRVDVALRAIADGGIDGYVMCAYTHAAAALIELQSGDPVRGAQLLQQAMTERQRCMRAIPLISIPTRLLLALAHLRIDDAEGARMLLQEIDEMLPPAGDRGAIDRRIDAVRQALAAKEGAGGQAAPSTALTVAEQRVLPYLQTHLTRPEIAERLFVSRHTVITQIASIFRKLGVSSRTDAVHRATALGLLGGAAPE
ncbi:MAG: helix-turn-helix transcriptional regulator [Microbacterium sp.]|nr:helix-turn-helix transcriptional regulator [Microbacterium sp.]